MSAPAVGGKKIAISPPFLTPVENKKFGATIPIDREIRCQFYKIMHIYILSMLEFGEQITLVPLSGTYCGMLNS